MYSCRRVSCEKYAHVFSDSSAASGLVISAIMSGSVSGVAFGIFAFVASIMWTMSIAPVSVLFVHSRATSLGSMCSTVPGRVTMKCGLFVAFWGPMGFAIAEPIVKTRNSRAKVAASLFFVLVHLLSHSRIMQRNNATVIWACVSFPYKRLLKESSSTVFPDFYLSFLDA